MKPIVNSQLTGKWYKITIDPESIELEFVEIFIYLSICLERTVNNILSKARKRNIFNCHDYLDLLYVGIKKDRSKYFRKTSLKILTRYNCNYLIVRRLFYRRKFVVLFYDEENGILILSDKKKDNVSIYSKRHNITLDIIEHYLSEIKLPKSIEIITDKLR